MPAYRSMSIIIRGYDFSEADRIVVAFTQTYGKIRAVAKGVRKTHSRLAASTGLLTLSELQFHGKEHQELYLVTQGQMITAFPKLKADLDLLGHASRLCELLDRLTPEHQPHPRLFVLARQALEMLEAGVAPALAGVWFDISCLDALGYGPLLTDCAICKKDAEWMAYVPEQGSVVCRACGSPSTLVLSRGGRGLLQKLRYLSADKVQRIRLDSRMEMEIQACLSEAFHYQLGRQLNTEKFRKSIAKNLPRKQK